MELEQKYKERLSELAEQKGELKSAIEVIKATKDIDEQNKKIFLEVNKTEINSPIFSVAVLI